MTLDQDLLKPIYELNGKWVTNIGRHILSTCERDHIGAEEAKLRLRTFAVITAGENQYSLRSIAEKFARGEKYEEIFDYAKRTYDTIESVRQWLKDDPDAQEEIRKSGINNVDWF